ncbi:MAG TPA: sulfatase, partial [Verrucomicrobiales bacterium]|nr:sulfatase [Verrucomicrobiales bacterium]
ATLALKTLLQLANGEKNSIYTAMLALNALDYTEGRAKPYIDTINDLPKQAKVVPPRMGNYIRRLLEKTTADLK